MLPAIRRAAFTSLLTLAPVFAAAQVSSGVYQFGAFDTPGPDTIDVGSLNVILSLPILHKTGRAGTNFTYDLVYNSSVWTPAGASGSQTWTPAANFGWLGQTEVVTGYFTETNGSPLCVTDHGRFPETTTFNARYYDTFGIEHRWSGSIQNSNGQCSGDHDTLSNTSTTDGKYKLTSGGIVDLRGNAVNPSSTPNGGVGSYTDTNGNQITTDGSGNFVDTTGATALTIAGTSPQTYTYKDTSGNPQKVTVSYKTYAVQTAFNCSGVNEANLPSTPLIDTITYADGSAYHFAYEPTPGSGSSGAVTGRLSGIQLPTGGVINYSYSGGSNGIVCADGSAAGLTRTLAADSGSAASTWTYTRTPASGTSHTDEVDGLGNAIAYDFVVPGATGSTTKFFYKVNRTAWNGGKSGTPVFAEDFCFNNTYNCATTAVNWPIFQTDTYDTYDGVQQSGNMTKWNSAIGQVAEIDTYDYGAGTSSATPSRGGLLNIEYFFYGGSTAPANFLSSDIIQVNGDYVTRTQYAYDQTTPAASSNVPSHVAVSGPRGNLTAITTSTSSSSAISTTMTYEDTGTLLTSTDSINGQTQYSWDPTFIYNTSVTAPTPSSGITLTTGAGFDTGNTGLLQSITDPNGAATKVAGYNAMLQPLEIDYPDGGHTNIQYRNPNQISVAPFLNSSHATDTETRFDGYGRASRVAVSQNLNGNVWYQHDTCYNANGQASFLSYQYQGPGFGNNKVCSGTGDTYSYDVQGRVTAIKHSDGTQIAYQYTGRATKATDENGVVRITQVDGDGRITIACEISSNTLQGDVPTSCGTDIAGTGFVTSYTYDPLNHKTTVTQGAQTRVFQTDWIGRPTQTMEPERGTTAYAYSNNGTGLVVTRTRPSANQTSASTTTTTTTQYDTLNRPVHITYSDGTPERVLQYDVGANWDQGQSYLKGRLAYMRTPVLSNYAGAIWSYDAMGRPVLFDQCFPNGCGNGATDRYTTAAYDWEGNLLSENDITNGTVSYTYSDANEVTGITGSVANGGASGPVISNVQNGPFGPQSYTLGNGLGEAITYDGLGRTNGKWLCKGGTPSAYCSNTTQMYGMTANWSGSRMTGSCDTVVNSCRGFGYDEFNRLSAQSTNAGSSFSYVYDRYGNRWQQNVTGGSGPQFQIQFDKGNNRDCDACYDAAGNKTSDGVHSYTYDAEGNVTAVDGGQTAVYTYDALNRRFRVKNAQDTIDYQFDTLGRRAIAWRESAGFGIRDTYWWGSVPTAYHALDGTTYYQQQDWLGTERMRTNSSGAVVATYTSLPFGDGFQAFGNSDEVPDHFAGTERDAESATDHAQFRQYQELLGRWMSPDPYDGSYDPTNPQSLNRYSYVLNNPLSLRDPLGLEECDDEDDDGGCGDGGDQGGGGGVGGGVYDPGYGGGTTVGGGIYVPCSEADSCVMGTPPSDPTPCGADCLPIGSFLPISTVFSGGGSPIIGSGPSNEPQEPPPPCQTKILNATNNQFGTHYTNANVNSTFNYSTGAGPGQGTLNLNIQGSTAGVSPGYYPVHWWSYIIGYGPTLHAVSGPGGNGGLDSQQTLPFGPNQATFHIDSGYPYNPAGAFFHYLLNLTKAGGYPQC